MQRMAIKRADYGDFNNNDVFDGRASIDAQCSPLSNCQVKSRCGGRRSCALTMGSNLLPSPYCRDTSKEIYIEYTCVDSKSSSLGSSIITAATKMRLTHWANEGFIQIKDGLIWRTVKEEHWDKNRQKMLCQHLGFKETNTNDISSNFQIGAGRDIATGSLVCYSKRPRETSCCINLVPSTSTSNTKMTWAKCKICDKPLSLSDDNKFSRNKVFSGSGGSKYYGNVRSNRVGWCASGSTSYLLLDLQKEYHLTHVMVIADRKQTKWSNSYSMKHSRAETLIDSSRSIQITENQNGYQASITQLDRVYNARYIKIQSNRKTDFCLRIELCGEVETPAPVNDIKVTPSNTSAQGSRTEFSITGLTRFTKYTVTIYAGDGSSQWSSSIDKIFTTNTAVPSGAPGLVAFTNRSKEQLTVSWSTPSRTSQNDKANDTSCGAEWYIVVVTLVSGIIIGILLSYIVSCSRRKFRRTQPQSNHEPKTTEADTTYQELDLTKLNTEDNYQSLRVNAEEESTYTDLNQTRDVEDNYQSLT
ncbi:neuronal cell adhesion molecule isoform X1 [Paramuricea clavata]|uniref:Neuronal cell adhesion molecule isoform X1 n=1 Tax=Paramuricea clavata TaxID=317549 RepID=A0A7D9IJP3_PARCT|nr:neuronal cell adhesion molecule isoform X1 [Paramuricea clavata]